MKTVTAEFARLRETDGDVALVLDTYDELERIYRDTLEAMGVTAKPTLTVENSAQVTLSFRQKSPSSSGS